MAIKPIIETEKAGAELTPANNEIMTVGVNVDEAVEQWRSSAR